MVDAIKRGILADNSGFQDMVARSNLGIVICDPAQDDCPIVYVNKGFEKLTLYSSDEAVGRNCRFLQGQDTAQADKKLLRSAISGERDAITTIVNYRKDGTRFTNHLMVSPVQDDEGLLCGYLGILYERSAAEKGTEKDAWPTHTTDQSEMLREIQHRVKNHLAMIVSLIRVQANRAVTKGSFLALSHRIEALAILYDELLAPGSRHHEGEIEADAYLRRVAEVVAGIDGRPGIRVRIECEPIYLAVDPCARLGLLLNELLTNAFNHAFDGREEGSISVSLHRTDDREVTLVVADDGIGLGEAKNWPWRSDSIREHREEADQVNGELQTTAAGRGSGLGGSIVRALTKALDADLKVQSSEEGTTVSVKLRPGGSEAE